MEVSIAEVVMTAEASVEGPCDVTQAPVPANMDLAANACGIFLFDPGAAFRHARIIRAGVAPARRIQHGEGSNERQPGRQYHRRHSGST
ncbi:MAG TPA: hypothetical protein VIK87_10265 [Sphingomonadales bacterium]